MLYELPDELMDTDDRRVWPKLMALLECSENPVARLLSGRSENETTAESSKELNQDIIKEHKTQTRAYPYLKCLIKLIEWVNSTQNKSICIAQIPVYTAPPISPFTEEVRTLPADYQRHVEFMIKVCDASLTPQAELGRVIYSAVVFGGLHHKYLHIAMMQVIHEPMKWLGGKVWMVLEMENRNNEALERRIWEPDPLTELLMINLSDKARGYLQAKWATEKRSYPIIGLMKAFMSEVNIPAVHHTSFKQLCKSANYTTSLRSPLHAGYYRREFLNHGLKPNVWERILGMPASNTSPERHVEATRPVDQTEKHPIDIESHWYNELRKLVVVDAGEMELKALLEQFDSEGYGYAPCLMVEWSIDTLGSTFDTRRVTTVNRAKNNLIVTGKYLVSHSDGKDITSLDADGLAELYEVVIESAKSPNHLRALKKGLKNFHKFMMNRYVKGELADQELFHNSGILPVDATIITEDEYRMITDRFITEPAMIGKSPKLAEVSDILTCIAYRTGTRRREVLYLTLEDLKPSNRREPHLSEEVDLLVRPNYARTLKSTASQRRLPLHALLEPEELKRLISWWNNRMKEESEEPFSKQLFAIKDLGWDILDQEKIIPNIHSVMRDEVGDASLRFHHLRHSAASWISLRLMLSDLECIPDMFPNQPMTQEWLGRSREFRLSLYRNSNMTRRHVYATAAILGHSTPEITLEHYLHLIDLIAPQISPQVSLKVLMRTSGIPEPTLYHNGSHKSLGVLLNNVRTRAVKKGRINNLSAVADSVRTEQQMEKTANAKIRTLWSSLLAVSMAHKTDMALLAESHNLDPEYLGRIIDRANYLSELPAHRLNTLQYDTFRHNPKKRIRTDNNPPPFHIPSWPRQEFAKNLVSSFSSNVIDLAESPMQVLDGGHTVTDVVDYVMENTWLSKNEIPFANQSATGYALGYRDLLLRMGLKESNIEYRTTCKLKAKGTPFLRWKDKLSLNNTSRIKHVSITWGDSEQSDQKIVIKSVFEQFHKSANSNMINNEDSASNSIHFLTYMLDIMLAGNSY